MRTEEKRIEEERTEEERTEEESQLASPGFEGSMGTTAHAQMAPEAGAKWISTHLPKRLELSLCVVLAFPKASSRSPDCSASWVAPTGEAESCASDAMQSLAVSVLPAPDSPETRIACGPPVASMTVYAERATLNT